MEQYIKQNVFMKSNISLLYLSPYTDIVKNESEVCLKRSDRKSMMVLKITDENKELCDEFLEKLRNGMSEEELGCVLKKLVGDESDDWINNCIWEGIIE